MNEINYDKLWEEIDEIVQTDYGRKLPHEKSVCELAKLWAMSSATAQKIIDELVNKNRLLVREATSQNGKKSKVYTPLFPIMT
jgi:hypothetical protein